LRPGVQPLKIPRARQNPPKEKQGISEQNEEFVAWDSIFFYILYKDLKIFLLMRFEKFLNTQSS